MGFITMKNPTILGSIIFWFTFSKHQASSQQIQDNYLYKPLEVKDHKKNRPHELLQIPTKTIVFTEKPFKK